MPFSSSLFNFIHKMYVFLSTTRIKNIIRSYTFKIVFNVRDNLVHISHFNVIFNLSLRHSMEFDFLLLRIGEGVRLDFVVHVAGDRGCRWASTLVLAGWKPAPVIEQRTHYRNRLVVPLRRQRIIHYSVPFGRQFIRQVLKKIDIFHNGIHRAACTHQVQVDFE